MSKVFLCIEVGTINGNLRRTECSLWSGLAQHLSVLRLMVRLKFLSAVEKQLTVDDVL